MDGVLPTNPFIGSSQPITRELLIIPCFSPSPVILKNLRHSKRANLVGRM